jgi:hypothetical protein
MPDADWCKQISRFGRYLCCLKSLFTQILLCHPQLEPKKSERLHKFSSLDACASELAIGFREQLASCHGGNFDLGEHKPVIANGRST